jgi:hypothetical protein
MTATGHQLEESIDQLAAMIEGAKQMAESGQIVELDVLAMKIAVLTDALSGQPGGDKPEVERPNPMVPKLERLMTSLDHLEMTLRTRNVNLALDLEQADRRLRAQVAYRSDRSDG